MSKPLSRRLLPVAGLCAVAAVVLPPSLAAAGGRITWWFQRDAGAPGGFLRQEKPITGVPSVISTGETNGKRWTAVAYLEKPPYDHGRENVTVTMLIGSLGTNPAGSAGVALYGLPQPAWVTARNARDLQSWFGFGDNPAWQGGPWIVRGSAAGAVDRLVIVSKPDSTGKRTTTRVPLVHVPAVGYGVRVFAFRLYPQGRIDTVSAYSKTGKLLQQYRNRPHPSGP